MTPFARIFALGLLAVALPGARADTRPITTAAALSDALSGDFAVGMGFDLTARVTRACSSKSAFLGVYDDSGAALLTHECDLCDDRIRAGDLIRVAGRLAYTSYGFRHTDITWLQILAHGTPLPVLSVTAADIQSGKADCRFVRTSGMLVNIQPDDIQENTIFLTLDSNGQTLFVSANAGWNAHGELDGLIGRRISVSGFLFRSELNWRRLIGRYVSVQDPHTIAPLDDDADRFAAPPLPTSGLSSPANFLHMGQRRARGQVLAVWKGRNLLVDTPSNGTIRVKLFVDRPPAVGAQIEVVGFPETDLFSVGLVRAGWRPADAAAKPPAAPVSTDLRHCLLDKKGRKRVNMSLFGQLITVRGRVHSVETDSDDAHIVIAHDGVHLNVDSSALRALPGGLAAGAVADFTGVFITETESWDGSPALPRIERAFLVLRGADDIRLVQRAPFVTSARLLALLIPLFILALAALVRARLTRSRAELKTQERTRIAVELHDALSQTLAGVAMEIAAADALRGNAPAAMVHHLTVANKALQSCRNELRNCLWDLRSAALDKPDMTSAILTTLQPHVNDGRLAVRFNVPRAHLSDDLAHAVIRIVRELVLNAFRHGNASTVRVAGRLFRGRLFFSVTDDGCGFDPEACPGVTAGHFGLQGIRERLDGLGGSVRIESAPGRGTYVRASIPLHHAGDEPSLR